MALIQVTERVRIEDSPRRKRETATKELLSDDVTAKHYQEGRPDAMGKPIKVGEPMDFIDWKSRERVWNVYREEAVKGADGKEVDRYVHKGGYETQEEAIRAAGALAQEG